VLKLWLSIILFVCGTAVSGQQLLFGGSGHDEFLGCLDCSKYDSDSICNKYGMGSRYDTSSIFNRYGTFGSKYSESSPWNKYSRSNSVPVVVDSDGNFYGYFTINHFRSDASSISRDLRNIYEASDGDLEAVRDIICE